MRKKIVAGNWKMNTLPAEGVELAKGVAAGRGEVCSCVNFIVCPPFTHLSQVIETLKGIKQIREEGKQSRLKAAQELSQLQIQLNEQLLLVSGK